MPVAFAEIYARAVARHGEAALAARLPQVHDAAGLAAVPDHRYLAAMTRGVFQAGFVWRVIEMKWPGFEAAFRGFEPRAILDLGPADLAALRQDSGIVRNGQKIDATLHNAAWVAAVTDEAGGFGRWLAHFGQGPVIDLWAALKRDGARLGGDTGPRFLRAVGCDSFILTDDVRAALEGAGVAVGKGSSQSAWRAAQAAFSEWQQQTGLPLAQLSVIAASSVGRVYAPESAPESAHESAPSD